MSISSRGIIKIISQSNLMRSVVLPSTFKLVRQSTSTMSSSPTYSAEYLKKKLEDNLEAQFVEIEDQSNCGCGMKFDALIVSPVFEGKPLLQRQRLVNQVLSEEMKYIHAFTMKTLAPSQWKN